MAARETVLSRDGEPIDLLIWRHRGRTAGLTEEALELNAGTADLGVVLPHGVLVQLPDAATAPPVRETVKLWG